MKINQISFGLTINMANYESARFDIQADLEEWEDPEQSMQVLREKLANIAATELSNGYSTLLGKINFKQKYICEVSDRQTTINSDCETSSEF